MRGARLIIAGSRTIQDFCELDKALGAANIKPWDIVCVASGMARGPDMMGKIWAHRLCIPCKEFMAHWQKHGRAAGFIRNREMAEWASEFQRGILLVLWDGQSRGTSHMIEVAKEYGLKTHVWLVGVSGGE